MYKDINIIRVGQFKQFINKAFISDKGIIAVVTIKRKIAIFHEDNPAHVIHLDRQLEQNLFLNFKKVKEIREIHNEDKNQSQTTLLFLIDSSLCLVSLNISTQNEESLPKIGFQRIKLINILDDSQIPQNNNNFIDLIDIRRRTALFTFWNRVSRQIKLLSYQIIVQNHNINIKLLFNCSLFYDEDFLQDQAFIIDSLLSNRFKVKWFDHYLIFFDQNISSQNVNRLYMADLNTCVEGDKFRIQNMYELPERIDYGFLKDILIMPLDKQINQLPVSLFFQFPKYLQIIEITLEDSKTPLKTIRHPFITLLSIVNSSISSHQLQIKGQNHCRETLTYLINFVNGMDQTNKLAIIGSPTAHKAISIVNEIELPKNISHLVSNSKNNYFVCRDQILKIILTPKNQLYRQMLAEINAEILRQMIGQFLE